MINWLINIGYYHKIIRYIVIIISVLPPEFRHATIDCCADGIVFFSGVLFSRSDQTLPGQVQTKLDFARILISNRLDPHYPSLVISWDMRQNLEAIDHSFIDSNFSSYSHFSEP